MKQACVTKWFKPIDPSKVGQYHEWLFEKELADREKRKAEHEARIKAERARLRQIQRDKEKKRKDAEKVKRDEEERRRAELARRKLEGQFVVPGVFLGGRLAAQNSDWILDAIANHKLSSVLNCTPNVRCYFDTTGTESILADADDQGDKELEELAQALDNVGSEPSTAETPASSQHLEKESSIETSFAPVAPEPNSSTESDIKADSSANKEPSDIVEKPEGEEVTSEEDEFFKKLDSMDDDAKLALLESIKLEGDDKDEIDELDEKEKEEEAKAAAEAALKVDAVKDLLERHKSRLARQKGCLPGGATLTYKRIPIEDDGRVDVSEFFSVANDFIASAVSRGEAVLVHCREGRSRSVTMVISYLILTLKQTLAEAMETIHKAIYDENANAGFKKQLMNLDFSVHGSHSIDYASKRDRKATINSSYSDNISEVTGAVVGRAKRPRRSTRASSASIVDSDDTFEKMDEDEEYKNEDDDDFKEPPTKIRATRSKMSRNGAGVPKSSTTSTPSAVIPSNTPSTSQTMDTSDSTPSGTKRSPAKTSPALSVEIPISQEEPTRQSPTKKSTIPAKSPESSPLKKPTSPSKKVSPTKKPGATKESENEAKPEAMDVDVDIMDITPETPAPNGIPLVESSAILVKEKPVAKAAAKPAKTNPTASPSKPTKAKKTGIFPTQSNTLFNYFSKPK